METVEVVIRLPKKVYEAIQQIDRIILGRRSGETIEFALWNGVKNGIVLPKGHGRLFILDEELTKKFFTSFSFSCQKWISEVGISNATLKVIETDKDGE